MAATVPSTELAWDPCDIAASRRILHPPLVLWRLPAEVARFLMLPSVVALGPPARWTAHATYSVLQFDADRPALDAIIDRGTRFFFFWVSALGVVSRHSSFIRTYVCVCVFARAGALDAAEHASRTIYLQSPPLPLPSPPLPLPSPPLSSFATHRVWVRNLGPSATATDVRRLFPRAVAIESAVEHSARSSNGRGGQRSGPTGGDDGGDESNGAASCRVFRVTVSGADLADTVSRNGTRAAGRTVLVQRAL